MKEGQKQERKKEKKEGGQNEWIKREE